MPPPFSTTDFPSPLLLGKSQSRGQRLGKNTVVVVSMLHTLTVSSMDPASNHPLSTLCAFASL